MIPNQFTIVEHPLLSCELTRLRDASCPTPEFRQGVRRIAALMVPAVTGDLDTEIIPCQTPLEISNGHQLSRPIVLVPVLRAGLAFLDGFLDLIPHASVAHIGLARNEKSLQAESYYLKHPEPLTDSEVIILDPMLATGGSAISAVKQLQQAGAKSLRFACLLAAPEGVASLAAACPGIPIFAAALDRCLNEQGFILPGLGDAGDRLFGTV